MEKNLANDCHDQLAESPQGRVGLNFIEELPYRAIPERILGDAMPHVLNAVNALSVEGPHGPAMRRLLSREVAVCRVEALFYRAILNTEATKFFLKSDNIRRLETAERLVANSQRRMLAAIDTYARASGGLPPRIHVTANQAVVAVGGPS